MKSWSVPVIPRIGGDSPPLHVTNTSTGQRQPVASGAQASMYVCGITPYDATHLGHAATYLTFDLVGRVLRDNGKGVTYVQNITDVDDPLLERATQQGADWRALAERETALFREDMEHLRIIPPDHYVGVVESIDQIASDVEMLLQRGAAYRLETADSTGQDVYLDIAACPTFGAVSRWTADEMLEVFPHRGGDPDRPGKRHRLDPLLWRAAREGEPAWPNDALGDGRPGWHIECTAIARDRLGIPFDLQGGGTDLIFPHHEMSAAQSQPLTGHDAYARCYVHQAMVGYQGEKMSKSLGNLVLVSRLRAQGVDPMAIRLLLLNHHYAAEWEYTQTDLDAALERLSRWRAAFSEPSGPAAAATIASLREHLANDLDAPGAVTVVDEWVNSRDTVDPQAPRLVADAVDALLGVR